MFVLAILVHFTKICIRDNVLKLKFSNDDLQCGGIIMSPEATEGIWIPDIHFQNRTYLKQDEEWKWLISSKISTENEIQLKYEIKFPNGH